jgi:GNAT superfamily N-acetyltransferase
MVRSNTLADQNRVITTVTLAFAADPVARWCWPDSSAYLTAMPPLIKAFAGEAFVHDGAHSTANFEGAALWLAPGVHSDDQAMEELIESSVAEHVRADLYGVFEKMAAYHPTEPHWYLPYIGVDPAHQGKGHGGELLTYALARCDREGSIAYLESTNPRNTTLYIRHGFEEMGRIQVGSSPPLIPMLRSPR